MCCSLWAETLTVLVSLTLGAASDSITTNGGSLIRDLGDDTQLVCHVNTKQVVSQLTWQRKRDEQFINFFIIVFSNGRNQHFDDNFGGRMSFVGQGERNGTMELKNITLNDDGIYKCIFTLFPHGLLQETLSLSVRVPPIIVIEPYPDIPVADSGESNIATCLAKNAKPGATINWESPFHFSFTQSATPPAPNGTVTVSSPLRLSPTREMNGQHVYCVVEHPALKSPEILDYKLNIHYMKSVTITAVKTEQESLQLKCFADANPSPITYTWTKENDSFPKSITEQEDGILTLPRMTPDLAGLYACETYNKVGSAKAFLYLYADHFTQRQHFMIYVIIVLLLFVIIALSFFLHKKISSTRNDTPSQQAAPLQQLENRKEDQDEDT
ncbi:nectin-3 isoform X2 [Callorhinchus milii]|uniref:Poliovirus receptor-related protein 3-like n=1 Tax=Callorhinchus milii TaxID=7868 RepID=A0A4W3IWN3_CALMI|nr:nectin-3 isoform X2 [Callorhinchus milii]